MKTKHTPGKWELNQVGVRASICINPQDPMQTDNIASLYGSMEDPEIRANANLMSAAPELLEAAASLLHRYVSLVECGDCGMWNPHEESDVIKAKAAIKKATS